MKMEPKLHPGLSTHYLRLQGQDSNLHAPEPNSNSDNRRDDYLIFRTQQPGLEARPELTTQFKKEKKGERVCTENDQKKNGNGCKKNDKEAQETGEREKKNVKTSETFWTVCSYCYNMYEYEKAYEECCLRCPNCRSAFHGVAVAEPNKNILVEGKDEYYCGLGFFGLKYSLNGSSGKDRGMECKSYNADTVVEISDDDDEGMNVKSDGSKAKASAEEDKEEVLKGNKKGMMQGSGKIEVGSEVKKRNVKSVARKSKKVMGRGICVKNRKIEAGSGSGTGDGCPEGDLEFFEKDGDVFVGIKSTF